MTEWKIDVEETKKLMEKNVFVLQNPSGKRFYMRTVLNSENQIDLIPLTMAELEELGITVEESYNESFFEHTVEESASEEPKKKIFNPNDPNDMAEAERIAREQLTKLQSEGKIPTFEKPEDKKDLEEENEDLKAKLQIVAEKELERKMNQLNVPESLKPTFRESPEKLQGFELAKKPMRDPNQNDSSMPLSPAQTGSPQGGYDSVEAMIDDLRKRAKIDPNAKACLDALWKKWYSAKESNPDLRDKSYQPTEAPLEEIKKHLLTKSAKEARGESV